MKKIILISGFTPTPDNYKAASALSYHILRYRSADVEAEVYSFNLNNVPSDMIRRSESDLGARIYVVPQNRWIRLMFRLRLTFLKNFLRYPFPYYNRLPEETVREIKAGNPDGIWINGDFMSQVARQFPEFRKVMTMPDCVCLYYNRLMADGWAFGSFYRMVGNAVQYYKNIKMEREYPVGNIKYHLVGEADKEFFEKVNPDAEAYFIRHPHYNYSDRKEIKFSRPKIKILLAGRNDLYMHSEIERILPVLCSHTELAAYYTITFLGRGWDKVCDALRDAGYAADVLGWADVYLDELVKYDIQLTPISIGTGTKGKVLDAMANGLLEIGTPYAMENIAAENGRSCLIYHSPEELAGILDRIPQDIAFYEQIAEEGRNSVLKEHNREKVSGELFSLFNFKG